jgi:hypothetical protein
MKKYLNFLFGLGTLFLFQCTLCQNEVTPDLCHKAIVIGKIRSAGGGIAVSMQDKTYGTHEWRGYQNVVEVLNIMPQDFAPNTVIYFKARPATKEEKENHIVTADGDESDKPLIVAQNPSTTPCETSHMDK